MFFLSITKIKTGGKVFFFFLIFIPGSDSAYSELQRQSGKDKSILAYITASSVCLAAQLCPTLRPIGCSPPGSSDPGILQARIPEWVAIPCSRGSSQPRD